MARALISVFCLCISFLIHLTLAESNEERPQEWFVLQKKGAQGIEQTSLLFFKDRVRLVTNSNFLTPENESVILGISERKLDPAAKNALLQLIEVRKDAEFKGNLLKELNSRPKPGHKGLEVFAGNAKLSPENPNTARVTSLINSLARSGHWAPVDTVRMTRKAQRFSLGVAPPQAQNRIKNFSCDTNLDRTVCRIDAYGTAYFSK